MKKAIIGSLLTLVIGVLASGPAVAQNNATVYVVHGINGTDLGLPKAAGVDVSVSGGCALTNFEYGTITDAIALPPGKYDIVVSLADAANPCGGAVVIEASVKLRHEETASIVAYLDESGTPTAGKFKLDVDPIRSPFSRFYVVHSADAPQVDVSFSRRSKPVKNAVVLDNLSNGEYDSVSLSNNVWKARIFAAQDGPKVLGPLKLKLNAGLVYVVYAVGTFNNGTFDLLVQAISIP